MHTPAALEDLGCTRRQGAPLKLRAALSVTLMIGAVTACGGDDAPEGQGTAGKSASANTSGSSSGGVAGKGSGASGGVAGAAPDASGGELNSGAGMGGDESSQAGAGMGEGGQPVAGGEGGQAGAGTGASVTLEVTPEDGGSVTLGDVVVDIPPGAVSESVTVTIELVDLSAFAPLPAEQHAIGPAVALMPHGLTFSFPVSLTLGHTGGTGGELGVVRLDDEADQSWGEVTGPIFTASDVTFEASTFSIVVPIETAAPGDVIHLHQLSVTDGDGFNGAQAVVFDYQDQLIVGSRASFAGELSDGVVIKLAPDPEVNVDPRLGWKQIWTHRVTSAPSPSNDNRDESVSALCVDADDNVLVAGGTYGVLAGLNNAGALDAFLRKLDSAGNALWTRQWGGVVTDQLANKHNDTAVDVAADSQDNVLVTGSLDFQGSIWIGDAYVRKLDPDGGLTWEYVFTPESSAHDYGTAVAVDPVDAVLVLGSTFGDVAGTNAGKADFFVSKLASATGQPVWTKQYGTAAEDCAQALALDANGDVFVAGQTGTCGDGAYPGLVAFVMKLDGDNGSVLWKHDVTTPTGEQRATAVSVDADGNALVVGHSTGSFDSGMNMNVGGPDVFVRKLNPSGTPLWTNLFGNSRIQRAYGVAVDSNGLVAVVGNTQGPLDAPEPASTFEPFVAWLLP